MRWYTSNWNWELLSFAFCTFWAGWRCYFTVRICTIFYTSKFTKPWNLEMFVCPSRALPISSSLQSQNVVQSEHSPALACFHQTWINVSHHCEARFPLGYGLKSWSLGFLPQPPKIVTRKYLHKWSRYTYSSISDDLECLWQTETCCKMLVQTWRASLCSHCFGIGVMLVVHVEGLAMNAKEWGFAISISTKESWGIRIKKDMYI